MFERTGTVIDYILIESVESVAVTCNQELHFFSYISLRCESPAKKSLDLQSRKSLCLGMVEFERIQI